MFTEDEKIIAKHINRKYKWIARDSDGNLCVYKGKPKKEESSWHSDGYGHFYYFNHLFLAVKWKDDEPTLIKDIYDPQILDDIEREYIRSVLKPFHDEVDYVVKYEYAIIDDGSCSKEYLYIKLHDGEFTFPDFDSGKMYSGMEVDKKYKLDELGIKY